MTRRVAAAILCLLVLGACGGADVETTGTGEILGTVPAGTGAALREALDLTPPDATAVYFTNWSELTDDPREILASAQGDRAFFTELDQRGLYPHVAYQSFAYPDHEQIWGWNTDEVEWEAAFVLPGDGAAVHLLRFADSFDTGRVLPLLEQRGYERSTAGGLDVYGRDEPRSASWYWGRRTARVPAEGLGMAPIDERTLLLSQRADLLRAAAKGLSGGGGAGPGMRRAVEPVGGSPAVAAFASDVFCKAHQLVADANPKAVTFAQRLEGRPYEGLAVGFAPPGEPPAAAVSLHYGDEAAAEADLEARKEAARGPSLATGRPYRQTHFTLESASVEGPNLVLRFSPSDIGTFGFAAAIKALDLTFAAC